VRAVAPDVAIVWNSDLPYGPNAGALWAGRGTSALVRAGVDARLGRVRLVLLPEATASQNAAFAFRRSFANGRSPYANPWWANGSPPNPSIDLPSRFGDASWRLLSPGQSSLTVAAGPVTLGVASENEWWGPGVQNALLLSNDAEGFPHALVRTTHPVRTRMGDFEARALLGALTPSLYLDSVPTTTRRSFSAAAVTWRPRFAPQLTMGLARTAVASIGGWSDLAARAADVLTAWPTRSGDSIVRPEADTYSSLFGRWVSAPGHVEVYGEVARERAPHNVRELLAAPHDGQALTLGASVFRPIGAARQLRVRSEVTTLEQSVALRDRGVAVPFYTGLATREGYTHRGQLLGATIGPGSSSQWLAVDLLTRGWQSGLELGRLRANNDALYDQPNANFFRHDVTLSVGGRVARRTPAGDLAATLRWARRDTYLFLNGSANPGALRTIDVPNVTATLSFSGH
jgi:hypothetical protein